MITALLSTRKNSALHHSQTLVKLRGCLCSLLCPEQYYMEVKTYKDNPVTEKVVLNETVVSTNVSLCVLHIVQPFWQCSVGFLVLNNPLQESASVTSTRPTAPGRDPTCALPTPFSSGAPAVSACLNIKLADGLRRTSFVMPLPSPTSVAASLHLPQTVTGSNICVTQVYHQHHDPFTAQCRMATKLCRKLLPMCHSPGGSLRAVEASLCALAVSWRGVARSLFLSGEASCKTHAIFSFLNVINGGPVSRVHSEPPLLLFSKRHKDTADAWQPYTSELEIRSEDICPEKS